MAIEPAVCGVVFLAGRVVFGGLLAFMGDSYFGNVGGMVGYAEAKRVFRRHGRWCF